MASLFNTDFTFSPPSSPTSSDDSTSATRSSSRAVSPCSLASAYPPPRFSVTDLACHLAKQNLRTPHAQMAYDSCAAYANTDGDEEGWAIPSVGDDTSSTLHRPRSHSSSRRAQRQQTTRLLCTAPHRGEIAALVARMVAAGEQCAVSSSSPTAAHEDEGYSSENDEVMGGVSTSVGSSRRPSLATSLSRSRLDSRGGGACVRKNIRLRKGAKERRTL